jgi:small subunit ribosomal protein S7
MSRDKHIPKREVLPDVKYNSILLSRFLNVMMVDGKKSTALKHLYLALEMLGEKTKKNPVEVFEEVIDKARPLVEVKSRRVGGANYQIPVEVSEERGRALVMRWIIMFARKRSEKSIALRIAGEMMDILNQTGNTYKKREDTHRMAEANKAFAHYRW